MTGRQRATHGGLATKGATATSPRPPQAVIYARYSSDLQRDASIEDQVRLCREWAERHGYEVARVHTDRATSGASLMRSGLQALLTDVRAGGVALVLTEALDRLSRGQGDVATLFEQLSFRGVALETVSEGRITEMHIGLKGTMNALYLKDLAQKTHRGLEGRILSGKSAGGLSYGYRPANTLALDGTRLPGDLEIVEAEAAVVRRIFQDYASGLSPKRIASDLNRAGVPGPRGGVWGFSTIYGNRARGTGLLNNELYVGVRVWNRQRFVKDPQTGKRQARPNGIEDVLISDVSQLRIVSDEMWEAVKHRQEITSIVATLVRPEERRRPVYLFSGLMVCGVCGGGVSMVGEDRVGCSAARNKGDTACVNRRTTSRSDVERRVLVALRERLMDPDAVGAFCEEYAAEVNRLRGEASAARAALDREAVSVTREIDRLIDAVASGMHSARMNGRIVMLERRLDELRAKQSKTRTSAPVRLHPKMADEYRRRVGELLDGLTHPESAYSTREAVRALVDRIVLTPEVVPGRKLPVVRIDLEGALASLLRLAGGDEVAHAVGGLATMARDASEAGGDATGTADGGSPNAEEAAPFGAASGLSRTQASLVAGAGFEPAAFRL